MRVTLLVLTIVAALVLARSDAWAAFDCFETPDGQRKCSCIGANDCVEMQKSDSCKSGPECDKSQLGAIICSCKAVPASRTGSPLTNGTQFPKTLRPPGE
jgi:hypothetical protein